MRSEPIMPHYVNIASAVLHTGINETVVVVGVKCLFAFRVFWAQALTHRRYEDAYVPVERWHTERKKYDSCKRWQCHRRQTKRWACVVGVWLKPYFFCALATGGAIYKEIPLLLSIYFSSVFK